MTAATLTNATVSPRVIGCDVGKATIVVFDSLTGQLDNTNDSLAAFVQGRLAWHSGPAASERSACCAPG
jgi:hypothetical protein